MKDSEGVMVGQHILIKVKKEKKKTPTLSQSQQESKGGVSPVIRGSSLW